jgi:hypothetical protein
MIFLIGIASLVAFALLWYAFFKGLTWALARRRRSS